MQKIQPTSHIGNELFPSLPTDGYPFAFRIPCNVLDFTSYGLVLVFKDMLLLCGIPDANFSRFI